MDQVLTVSALARMVNRSTDWVRQHADTGALPCTRSSSGHRLFNQDAVQAAQNLQALIAGRRKPSP